MRKEVIAATIGGLFLGLIITFGVWRTNSALSNKDEKQKISYSSPDEIQTTLQNNFEELKLTLANPEEDDVASTSPIAVSGITKKNAWVVVTSDDKDFVAKTDESGAFKVDVELAGGLNQIPVFVFDDRQNSTSLTTYVVYSTEFAQEIKNNNDENNESLDPIREKVQEKLQTASLDAKFYMGLVTDKTDTTIQIKNAEGEIKFVSIDGSDLGVVRIAKTTTAVKFDDIAIGDHIAALGFKNGNGVLETKRILITNPPEKPAVIPLIAEVKSIKGKSVVVQEKDKGEITLSFPARWKGPEVKDLGLADVIIVVGELKDQTLKVRTLYIAHDAPTPTPTPKESQ